MPVQTSYPGVYIQEVPSGVNTITGVATSIAAFIGRTAKGPLDRAVRCLSYTDFQRNFGGAHPKSDLSASVKQFFDNGGTDCYVIRIAHNAAKAVATLKSLSAKVLVATARDGGLWGNNVYLTVDYNTPTPDETFNLVVTYEEAGKVVASETHTNLSMNPNHVRYAPVFVSQSSSLITLAKEPALNLGAAIQDGYSEARTVFDTSAVPAFLTLLNGMVHHADPVQRKSRFTLSVDGSPYYDIDLHLDPANIAGATLPDVATDIQTRINTQLNAVQAGLKVKASWETVDTDRSVLRLTSDTADKVSVKARRSQSSDFAGPMLLGIDQGGFEPTRYRNFRPVPNATFLSGDINTLAKQTQNAFTTVTVSGTSVNLVKNGTNVVQTTGAAHNWYKDASGGTDGVREKLKILAKHINAQPNLAARAEVWGYHLALIPTSGTNNTSATFTTAVAAVDGLFTGNTARYALGTTSSSTYLSDGANGRDDDGNPLAVTDYLGSQADQTGIYALDGVDLFNLALIPGDRDISESDYLTIATTFSGFCKKKRAFLILDAPDSWTVKNRPVADASDVNDLRAYVVTDHSAVYYPKVVYSDAGVKKTMGPSGMIAGLYARTDNDAGVWKAPAGVNATLLGAIDLELNLTDGENGVLNKLGVNCLRKFPSGNVSWGARTLAGSDDLGSEWKYVPIRRLALMIGESLYRGTKWAVFEPNDEPLWARIRLSVGTFMHNLFRQGAFQGSTPSVAYYVKCDQETTTQADRNLGIVNIQVGFAPLKPAEFIVIQIQQMAGEL